MSKIAVITGAASGLGKALALKGNQLGLRLVLADHNRHALEEVVDEIKSIKGTSHRNIVHAVSDVSKMADLESLSQITMESFGTPHLIFNNAGIARCGFTWEHSPEEWQWFLGVNIMGVVHGIRAFVPLMLSEAKSNPSYRGRIINTASMAGLVSMPLSSMYNVSKHAVVTLTETLYHDLQTITNQVSASVLCPFYIPTNISKCPEPPNVNEDKYPSQRIGEAFTAKAVSSGKVSADDVADAVFRSIENEKFYIYSHPQALGSFQARAEDILTTLNPRDPYASKPQVGEYLRNALKDAYKHKY